MIDLITFQCLFLFNDSHGEYCEKIEFQFDQTNLYVLESDIINIRYDQDFAHTENGRHCTYLDTMLIELDGLEMIQHSHFLIIG